MCEDLFSSYALNATERLVLSDLNYSLLGISSPELLNANMAELKCDGPNDTYRFTGSNAAGQLFLPGEPMDIKLALKKGSDSGAVG